MKTLEHILLIDDCKEDNEFHEIAIRDAHISEQITVISDAQRAIDFFKNTLQSSKISIAFPELMFMDIMMPRMDGFELLDNLRQLIPENREYSKKPKVFILSGAYTPVIDTYLSNPNYNHLVLGYRIKPLTKQMLTEIVEKHF